MNDNFRLRSLSALFSKYIAEIEEYKALIELKKIRDEKKFDSLNSLKNQLQIDKKTCLNLEKIYKKK